MQCQVARVERLVVEASMVDMAGADVFSRNGVELVGSSTLVYVVARLWGASASMKAAP